MSWHHDESMDTSQQLLDSHVEAVSHNDHESSSDRGVEESQLDEGRISELAGRNDIELRSIPNSRDSPDDSKLRNFETENPTETVDAAKKLKRHFAAVWLASIFALFTIFTWIITCVLCYKPVQFGSYYDKTGKYTPSQYSNNDGWRKFSRVMLQVLSNVSIPVTSAVCARAVVIYSQKTTQVSNLPTLNSTC